VADVVLVTAGGSRVTVDSELADKLLTGGTWWTEGDPGIPVVVYEGGQGSEGPPGPQGESGESGQDSTVPGPQGERGEPGSSDLVLTALDTGTWRIIVHNNGTLGTESVVPYVPLSALPVFGKPTATVNSSGYIFVTNAVEIPGTGVYTDPNRWRAQIQVYSNDNGLEGPEWADDGAWHPNTPSFKMRIRTGDYDQNLGATNLLWTEWSEWSSPAPTWPTFSKPVASYEAYYLHIAATVLTVPQVAGTDYESNTIYVQFESDVEHIPLNLLPYNGFAEVGSAISSNQYYGQFPARFRIRSSLDGLNPPYGEWSAWSDPIS
jgi:hypothetical protein